MLVRLSISQWTARKKDKKATQVVHETYNASSDTGQYNKYLVARDALKEIMQAANASRTYHYSRTLPWTDDGTRILPTKIWEDYTKAMRLFRSQFEAGITGLATDWPRIVDEARRKLNGLFNETDYPRDIDALRRKYNWDVKISPLPTGADFRVSLSQEDTDAIRAQIDRDTREAVGAAMRDVWTRLYDAVAHMSEKLSDPKAIFRDTLVTNLTELTALLPALNLTEDPELDRMAKAVEADLCKYSPEGLREMPVIRAETATKATEIMAAMAGYMGGTPQ
jgi:hypothetical protein